MSYAVCTLFEGNYHYGLAGLCNSLYRKGFRGSMYAGYRGALPPWASSAYDTTAFEWNGSKTLKVKEGFKIHFLPLDTIYHFSNYKPQFMLRLFEGPCSQENGVIYFDPDIVVKCHASFFETWIGYGVALIDEVISHDMFETHPIRKGWEQLIIAGGRKITASVNSYINGGFCGVHKNDINFLNTWVEFIELSASAYGQNLKTMQAFDRTHLFYSADQDALNITAMCSGCPISELGPDGMDFIPGGWAISHATCRPKPWNKNYFKSFLKGRPPTRADFFYWINTLYPIPVYPKRRTVFKMYCLKIASFLGRFYRRY